MRPRSLKSTLNVCLNSGRAVFVWGPPGVGKSDLVASLALQRKEELRDVRLNMMDPTDLKGLPFKTTRGAGKKVHDVCGWLTPDFLPTDGKGILFLDELNSAPPSVQAAGYQLILNRRLGDYVLPDGWGIIAAGNRAGDRAIVHAMPSPLANRFVHLDFTIHNEDWHEWADKHDINTIVTGFLRYRPALLHKYDAKDNPRAFPTPRSWSFVSQLVGDGSLSGEDFLETLTGTVGEGAAIEFTAYMQVYRGLPTAESIIKKPLEVPVPGNDKQAERYATVSMLPEHTDAKTIAPIMLYINRFPVEFQVCFMRTVLTKNTALTATAAVRDWIAKNSSVLTS